MIDLPEDVDQGLGDLDGEVSPDGRAHWPVVQAKLDRMHREEPTLTPADLASITTPALLMFADDEIEIEWRAAGRAQAPVPPRREPKQNGSVGANVEAVVQQRRRARIGTTTSNMPSVRVMA
ncbi:MAG: hypothetical protein WKF96_24340 [Solirubrobacteraceae bacterium]